jgi:hypothetical protein
MKTKVKSVKETAVPVKDEVSTEDLKEKCIKIIDDLATQLNIRSKMEGEARIKLTTDLNTLFQKVGSSLNSLDLKIKSIDIAMTALLEMLIDKNIVIEEDFKKKAEEVYIRTTKEKSDNKIEEDTKLETKKD